MNQNRALADLTLRQALIRGLDKQTCCDTLCEYDVKLISYLKQRLEKYAVK